ncbi:peroxygenase-like [Tasmannia lanceolata]|uniref:peroxygenase-like n=1 Tax=Tasmannia lanceolata TaxID=3420 RepID=UPI004064984E
MATTHPNGSEGHEHHNLSALQQHVAFFDRNKDGLIYPWETYQGFRAIGCGFRKSLSAALLINLAFSYITLPGRIPSLLFPIYIRNIHKLKHGSDTETYDTQGRFDQSKFDAIFSKYATTNPNALTSQELSRMLKANRKSSDSFGWIASLLEWKLLYKLAKDEDGLLQRDTVRGVFDGTLFERLEKERAFRRKNV